METIIDRSVETGNAPDGSADVTLSESGFYWREAGGIKVLVSRPLEAAGFANGFSTRLGGVSDLPSSDLNLSGFDQDAAGNIFENRRRFLSAINGRYELALAWQVHGDVLRLVRCAKDVGDSETRADGVLSNLEHVLAGVKTADCVPVLIGDPVTRSFAAVHAGWRGTASSIVGKAVAQMTEFFGSNAADLVCAIGPAAGCERYEVGSDVIDLYKERFADSERFFSTTRPGHALIDLKLANREQLTNAGVRDENIFVSEFCTMERTDLFFSYRIEKERLGRTGRQLSVIGRADRPG